MSPLLAYLALQDVKQTMMGVIEKIINQAKAMNDLYPSFSCFVIGNHDQSLLKNIEPNDYLHFLNVKVASTNKLIRIMELRKKTTESAYLLFSQNIRPDFLYFRYPLGCPWSLALIKKLSTRGIRIITEHQSLESKELFSLKKYPFWLSEELFGSHFLKHTYAVVGVTEEILKYESKRAPQARTMCIPNGIDTSKYRVREIKYATPNDHLDILFVGTLVDWHGLDRLIMGIKRGDNVRLHIVGEGEDKNQLKTMAEKRGLQKNVIFHGFMHSNEMNSLYDRCHFAVSSLGLFRKSLTQASPLKSREYTARGIPFIMGFFDPDFQNIPWTLRLKNNDTPISIDLLKKWFFSCHDCQEPHVIRQYAIDHLEYVIKFDKLNTILTLTSEIPCNKTIGFSQSLGDQ